MSYCKYYQAHVFKEKTWFFVAILRSYEHLCFDRTLDKSKSIFEFYVPEKLEPQFLKLMNWFAENNIIKNLEKFPNRLELGQEL